MQEEAFAASKGEYLWEEVEDASSLRQGSCLRTKLVLVRKQLEMGTVVDLEALSLVSSRGVSTFQLGMP